MTTPLNSAKRSKVLTSRISELPDDVVARTLSFLPIREASRTSILSSRWRYLWKDSMKFYSSLTLDELSMRGSTYTVDEVSEESHSLETVRFKFVGWVDQMLESGYGRVIDSFRLRFSMTKDFAHFIDQWIKVAVTKRAQRYDIDLSGFHPYGLAFDYPLEDLYTFPVSQFTKETGRYVTCLHLKSCALGSFGINFFSSLADLQLEKVLLDQDSLIKFLSDCPSIEKLSLVNCLNLHRLSISGPSLKLKQLKIIRCPRLCYIEIKTKNLTRFEYYGGEVQFSFVDARALSDFYMLSSSGFRRNDCAISYAFTNLSSELPLLETLFLQGTPLQETKIPTRLPIFENLKKLGVLVEHMQEEEESLWGFIDLLHASPGLQRLELHLSTPNLGYKKRKRPRDVAHLHLKEIMVSGFQGESDEIELMIYFLSNCVALQKVTLDQGNMFYDHTHNRMCAHLGSYISQATLVKHKKSVQEQIVPFVSSGVEFLYIDGLYRKPV